MTTDIVQFLESLNVQQREAVEFVDGASLVIAGAGSGKTRVLTYKIAYLIAGGIQPRNILALTFTNKAADEMKERIASLVGVDKAYYLHMGTFHSIFSHILRREASVLGFNAQYTIYDEADSRQLLKIILKELGLDEKVYKPSTVHARISMAKNYLILPDAYARHSSYIQRDKDTKMPRTAEVYAIYQQRLLQSNAMDFDDLLVNTYLLFNRHEEIRQKYATHFQYVLVDEYQDTNYVQQCIILQLTKDHGRVCVVGDDAQSIYAFRGANIDNILDFQKQYPESRLFKLERNYRSTETIVEAANSLIQHNERQIQKNVFSKEGRGEQIVLHPCLTDKEETLYVCREIARLHQRQRLPYNNMAVLYRTNAQSRVFEDELRKQGITYRIYGGISFYQRKEVKDIMAYFRLTCNEQDETALRRIINYPTRGIGNTTITKVEEAAKSRGLSMWQMLAEEQLSTLPVNKATADKLRAFRNMITSFADKAQCVSAFHAGKYIIEQSGMADELMADNTVEGLTRQDNVDELLNSIAEFIRMKEENNPDITVSLSDFLQDAALRTDMDQQKDNEDDAVTLMTAHSAKGLEFDAVFIVGLEENIFPSQRSFSSMRELEEERRLLYVALTRAKRHCFLTYAENRFRYGTSEYNSPSRFIKDIASSCIKNTETGNISIGHHKRTFSLWNTKSSEKTGVSPVQSNRRLRKLSTISGVGAEDNTPSPYKEGMRVKHSRFGEGTVVCSEGSGENLKVKVRFDAAGEKQLLAKFAQLTILA